jgi:acetolactate synthase-1/2/3 large subunit
MNNAELLVALLRERGVRWAFGIPSGPVLPLIEAMRSGGIEFVLTASETSAGFMATTVAALTGTPGVCVATVGPGATNLTTGVGAAWLDCAPVIAITCNVGTAWLERRIQMRIDHHALFAPLTKASYGLRVGNVENMVRDALTVASQEPPGPVHLDFPEDVALAPAEASAARVASVASVTSEPRVTSQEVASQVAEALARARRPLLLTGLSLTRSRAHAALRQFAEHQHIPFVSTLHAKGCLPESHPLWAGVVGRARRSDVQAFINRADLILAVGFDPIEINYEEFSGAIPVMHVDGEAADVSPSVNMRLNTAVPDLDAAIAALAEIPSVPNNWSNSEIDAHRAHLDRALRPDGAAFATHHALDALRTALPLDGVLAYDVGAHTHQIASQWRTDCPGTCLSTNGWSSMGFGMPAAYAAALAEPDRRVVAVVGDGCFRMTAGELDLARRLNLRVPVIVLNDGWLGLMKVKQQRREYPLSGVQLAQIPSSPEHYFGVPCRGVRTLPEFQHALEWALALDGPSVIEAYVDVEPYLLTVFD